MVGKVVKLFLAFCISVPLILLCAINIKLYHTPAIEVINKDNINIDLLAELQGVKHSLQKGADADMQKVFPEGFVFMNALYGLAWCNFVDGVDPESAYSKEGMREIQNAYDRINSPQGRDPFDKDLPISYGAFYTGWSTYLLGNKLNLQKTGTSDPDETENFKTKCSLISRAIQANAFPVSYPGSAWPADAMVCVATLSLHDKLYTPLYKDIIDTWITTVKAKLDHHGLIPHAVDASTGEARENARGSSQSLMLIFLREIDRSFGDQQYNIYATKFPDTTFGLIGVREYPAEEPGMSDVDSGPIVFGMGSAATIVGMATMYQYDENKKADRVRQAVEALGLPFKIKDRRVYLLGSMPMADAFICWTHSYQKLFQQSKPTFISFHIYSVVIVLGLVAGLYLLLKRR